MKAVILAGGESRRLAGLSGPFPSAMLPILNRPLVEHNLQFLRKVGIKEVAITLGSVKDSPLARHIHTGRDLGVEVRYFHEDYPQGTAGALRPLKKILSANEPFLALSGATFLYGSRLAQEISQALEHHAERNATATLLVCQKGGSGSFTHQPSVDRRRALRFQGIYILGPEVFRGIPEGGYLDIKEQLLPSLQEMGLRIQTYKISECEDKTIGSLKDYYQLNRTLLRDASGLLERELVDRSYRELSTGIWIGTGVKIAPTAYLVPPIILGDRCRIDDHAQVVGPAVLGAGTAVGQNALLRETITWGEVTLEEGSRVSYSVLQSSTIIGKDQDRSRTVLGPEMLAIGDFNLIQTSTPLLSSSMVIRSIDSGLKRWFFPGVKRTIDLICSLVGIVALLPLILILAALIKWDSPGPVFFRQLRCGRRGKLFWMIKFRTTLDPGQGPLEEEAPGDPAPFEGNLRFSRVGRFLCKSSLDEIPQLMNVLMGEMSLVGPRPLVPEYSTVKPVWRDLMMRVRPGVTGTGRLQRESRTDSAHRDIEYIRQQSVLLDFKILLKTVLVVLKGV